MPEARKFRVLIADDHRLFRESLAVTLQGERGIEVVGQAGDGVEAVEMCRRLQPDVVLMDLSMPRMDGINATRQIVAEVPNTRVIALSMHDQAEAAGLMLSAGAEAYVTKTDPVQRLIGSILRSMN